MTRLTIALLLAPIALLAVLAGSAGAFDADQTFAKGTWIGSFEAGGGAQMNIENKDRQSNLEFWYLGARLGLLPFRPLGSGFLHGAFEIGLEPLYQHYTAPKDAYYAGLAAMGRYHFLSLGRVVPYVELAGAAGGTNLHVFEIASHFAFWIAGGVGASFFVTDAVAVYGGYRMVHVSNGNTSKPNRGFEASTGVAGVSFFFK